MQARRLSAAWLKFAPLGFFLLGVFIAIVPVSLQDFWGMQARFLVFVAEMSHEGIGFFPTIWGVPYPDYLSLSFLPIHWLHQLTGTLTYTLARIPTAIYTGFILLAVYLIGVRSSLRTGVHAVLGCLMTFGFLAEARSISLDQAVSCVTIWIYLLQSMPRYGLRQKIIVTCLLATGFLLRGPIGCIVPAGVMIATALSEGNYRLAFLRSMWAGAVFIVCLLLLLGFAYFEGGDALLHSLYAAQWSSRVTSAGHDPYYSYFTSSLGNYALIYPLGLYCLYIHYLSKQHKIESLANIPSLIGYVLVIMFGMSLPARHAARYVVSMVPALALIVAQTLNQREFECRLLVGLKRPTYFFALALAVVFIQLGIIEPFAQSHNASRAWIMETADIEKQTGASWVFYHMNPDGIPVTWLGHLLLRDLKKPVVFTFLQTEEALSKALADTSHSALILSFREDFLILSPTLRSKMKALGEANVAHQSMVACLVKSS